jgi:hypothetical protein
MEKQKDIPNKRVIQIRFPYKGYAYYHAEIETMRKWLTKNLPHLNAPYMKDREVLEYIDNYIESGLVPFRENK